VQGAKPPLGVQGAKPPLGVQGAKPPPGWGAEPRSLPPATPNLTRTDPFVGVPKPAPKA
jgi:hypothetical protein